MKVKDLKEYEEWKNKNTDMYGSNTFSYAERWADLMEKEIIKGTKVEDIAERLSHEAYTNGITGFMYGASVNILSHCWVYGDDLKRWHNMKYAYKGNGVVNPVVLDLKKRA